ncbi:MAG: hypothetical protein KKA05_03850, partial [Alphaproteobacteria bacterium]|nr:hypothetical protein [Alphaproteobacteria bacterium]
MVLVDELPPENSRRKKWFWRIFKILCVLAVMFTIGLVILSRLGGNNDNLRAGLESLIGGAAGDYPARVGRLHGLSFFPFIRVYADDISIMPRPGTADTEQPLMTVGTIMFSRGFWDSFFWKNRIEGIRVENIDITADFITPRALIDGHIEMGPESFENTPGLLFTGTYGSQKFEWRMGLTLQSRNLRPVYSLSEAAPVTFVIGDVKAKGKIVRPHGGGVSLQIDELSVPGHTEIDVKGAIKIVRSASLENYEVSLITTNSNVAVSYKDGEDIDSLTIAAEKLARSEIRPLLSLLSALQDIYKEDTPGIDLGDIKKISLKIENLHDGAKDWGYFDLSGTVDDAGLLTVNDL